MATSLENMFFAFSKIASDQKSDGKTITLRQIDSWFRQAKIFDKDTTLTDTGVCFNKFRVRAINYSQFLKFLEDLSSTKNLELPELKEKLTSCGHPSSKEVRKVVEFAAAKTVRLQETKKGPITSLMADTAGAYSAG